MKKIIISVVLAFYFSPAVFSQNFSLQGGLWIGSNGTTTLLGLPGPKIVYPFSLGQKYNGDFGVTGIPGFFIEKDKDNNRLGLSLGPTFSISKKGKKGKLVFGAMLFKTKTWYCVPGVGWVF